MNRWSFEACEKTLINDPVPVTELSGADNFAAGRFEVWKAEHSGKKMFCFLINSGNSQHIFFRLSPLHFSQQEVVISLILAGKKLVTANVEGFFCQIRDILWG